MGKTKAAINSKPKIKGSTDWKKKGKGKCCILKCDSKQNFILDMDGDFNFFESDSTVLMFLWQCVYSHGGFRTLPLSGHSGQGDVVFRSGCQLFQSVFDQRDRDILAH